MELITFFNALQKATAAANMELEQRQISDFQSYFNPDGTPITQTLSMGDSKIEMPLYCLAARRPLLIKKMQMDLSAELVNDQNNLLLRFGGEENSNVKVSIVFEGVESSEASMRVNDMLLLVQHGQ
jgi:hypothetical protein